MRMVDQGLGPSVQQGDKPNLGPQIFSILSQLKERFRGSLEKKVVDDLLIPQSQWPEPLGKRKHQVKIRNWQQILLPGFQPPLLR
jgi:hypothetical protein